MGAPSQRLAPVADSFGRPLRDLRISVTDRCNLRCRYCMPREVFGRSFQFLEHSELLRFEEIALLARAFAALGVRDVRLTGGEPLLRRDIERLVSMLKATAGVREVALTTNGTILAHKAQALREAGLDRVTVSLDALDQRTFQLMTDTPIAPERVLEGIEAALAVGFRPVKVNMVVRRGVNDHCILPMAERFRGSDHILRFIEYMDVGESNGWRVAEVLPAAQVRALIESRWPLEAIDEEPLGTVARRYRYRDGGGEVGFIASVSEPFCGGCTRARLSAEGHLYTCLFASRGLDLRGPLRAGAGERELAALIAGAWAARRDRYSQLRSERTRVEAGGGGEGRRGAKVEMSYIGG